MISHEIRYVDRSLSLAVNHNNTAQKYGTQGGLQSFYQTYAFYFFLLHINRNFEGIYSIVQILLPLAVFLYLSLSLSMRFFFLCVFVGMSVCQ